MLQNIRDRTQGWIAGIIISLVILSFALWGIHSYLVGAGNTDVIAKVNGVEITKRQLSSTYDNMRRQLQTNMGPGGISADIDTNLRRQALDALINIQVLKQSSLNDDYKVSSRQVDYYLESMPEFQVNGQFSLPRFQQLIASSPFSIGNFFDLIETTLLIDQPRLGIILSSFSLPNEVVNSIALINQERNIDYINLPRDYFLKQNIQVTEDEIQAYYKQHQDEYKTPEQVSINYIELSHKALAKNFKTTDDVLKNFYNENLNTYTQPEQWNLQKILVPVPDNANEQVVAAAKKKAADLRDKIVKGADFSAIALQYPAGDNTKADWVGLNQLPSDLQKPVSNLTIAGQVSNPIKTDKGFLLLKAAAITPSRVEPFDQVKDKIKQTLAMQQAEEKFSELKEKLANTTYEHPDSLEPAAKELNLTIQTSPVFTREKGAGNNEITNNKKVREIAFSDDVLVSQNNSDVIQVSPDASIVIRIKSHTPATVLPLDAVHKQIADQIMAQKAEDKDAALAAEIKQKLQSGAAPDQVAQQYQLSWNKAGYIGRYSTKVDPVILYAAFRLPRPTGKPVYGIVKTSNGFAVLTVNAVQDGKQDASKDQYEAFSEQIQNNMGALEYKLYQQSLTKKAKIVSYMDSSSNDNT